MDGGIDQLVNTYKGNPQPLAQKVQKAQQGQPPGEVPPDLEEAIALQKIAALRNSAQGQQAMQAGGAQQSVVDKLKQMLGGMQQQAQMQAQPVMAASGGSIDQLMSNLGQNYAGGGIIAFQSAGSVKDPNAKDEEDKKPLRQVTLQELAEEYNRKRWAQQAEDEANPDPNKQLKDEIGAAVASGAALAPAISSAQMAKDMISRGLTQPIWKAGTSAPSVIGQTAAGASVPLATVAGGTAASYKAMKDLQAMSPEQRRALAANPMLSAMSGDAGLAAAIQEAASDEPRKNKSSYLEQVGNALATIPKMAGSAGLEALKHIVSAPGYGFQSDFSSPSPAKEKIDYLKPSAAALAQGVAPMPGPGGTKMGGRRSMDEILAAQAATNAAKPAGTGAPGAAGAAKSTEPAEPTDPLEIALRKSITEAMGKDPDEVRRKAIEANKQAMGLDALLKPAQDRLAKREAMIEQIKADRQPLWITALQNAGNKPGNIAQVLNQMATGVSSAKQGFNTQDLKFLDELNDLYAGIDKAKIEGRYKDVAAGEAAIKDLIADKRQAEQSGTSLLNTKENVRGRMQSAKDAAAARAQSAAQHNAQMALALEEKKRQFEENQLRLIREKDVTRANMIENAIAKRAGMIDMQLQNPKLKPEEEAALQTRRNAIVKQVMAEYPSVKPEKPSESQFLAAARAANPGVSEAELKAYYKQNYGK